MLVGAALGVAGTLLWQGAKGPKTPDRMLGVPRRGPRARALSPAGRAARLARQALRAEPVLAPLGLRIVPVSAGVVELHGWVESRALRTLALRAVRETPTVERVVNKILVRGEDDLGAPVADRPEQTA
jgi:hypothetical protein